MDKLILFKEEKHVFGYLPWHLQMTSRPVKSAAESVELSRQSSKAFHYAGARLSSVRFSECDNLFNKIISFPNMKAGISIAHGSPFSVRRQSVEALHYSPVLCCAIFRQHKQLGEHGHDVVCECGGR